MASPPPIACCARPSACTGWNGQLTRELSFTCRTGTGFASCLAQVWRLRISSRFGPARERQRATTSSPLSGPVSGPAKKCGRRASEADGSTAPRDHDGLSPSRSRASSFRLLPRARHSSHASCTTIFCRFLKKFVEKANAEICSPSCAPSDFIRLLSGFWHLRVGRGAHVYKPPRKCRSAKALSWYCLGYRFGGEV